MKKISNILFVLASLLSLITFTSCDDDMEDAVSLDGIWQGTIDGNYYTDRYKIDGKWDTEIQFEQNLFSRKGTGTEIDYSHSGKRAMKSRFDWQIKDRFIYITYKDGYKVVIRDYEIYSVGSSKRFRGYFDDIAVR